MKQVIQSYKTGKVALLEVPVPQCGAKQILVRNHFSLISMGTERSMIELGKKSLVGKAKARPDLVKRVIDKAKKEGVVKTFKEAMGRLDTPSALGYSCAGKVVETGVAAHEFAPGDRVACVGHGYASHAEFVAVPINMACRIPDNVSDEQACFSMLGVIALHGVRQANLTFGSQVVVIGLGLLGLLTVQILKAYGCRVIAMDLSEHKCELATACGADFASTDVNTIMQQIESSTHSVGADAVIITAATQSSQPVDLAIDLLRAKGKCVVVGVADIHPDRNALWEKEIELVVSKAGGAGALYEPYEKQGVDFPAGEVRWTQKRNVEEFLRLLSIGAVKTDLLTTRTEKIDAAEEVYQSLLENQDEKQIGVLFEYDTDTAINRHVALPYSNSAGKSKLSCNVIGAGLFAKALLLPELAKIKDIELDTLITTSGMSAEHAARKFGFANCSTDADAIFGNDHVDAIFSITPHSQHAAHVLRAIQSGKALFVEKPLCINMVELNQIQEAVSAADKTPIIMVGHNRRFSPHAIKIRSWLSECAQPMVLQLRVNAGFVPADHWVHQDHQGRSRIVGEISHFIDLMQYLVNSKPVKVYAERVSADDQVTVNNDNVVVNLKFANGSVAALAYTGSGAKADSREQLEIFCGGSTIRSTDFRCSVRISAKGTQKFKTSSQQMGYREELRHFIGSVKGTCEPAVPIDTILTTMRTVFAIEQSLATGKAINLEYTFSHQRIPTGDSLSITADV
ncbi:MAG: bi-domain-containing oxidoreductase [Gammaproteobacteria bacterium]|nr:bi-domain-containing oxidoreductase [Gammaproteobacteria bacterium]MCH9743674.1 bi-domain-containing oxidoreductase [Gammaproteobacteria bacterium]